MEGEVYMWFSIPELCELLAVFPYNTGNITALVLLIKIPKQHC